MGDMATEHDDKDKEAEDGVEDNADDADKEAALVLEQVLSLGPGPITCSNQHRVESVQQMSTSTKECGPKQTVQIQSSVGHRNAHTRLVFTCADTKLSWAWKCTH